jgi:hypothetical protein
MTKNAELFQNKVMNIVFELQNFIAIYKISKADRPLESVDVKNP